MNPHKESPLSATQLQHASIREKKGVSIVWLIPLVAILIAAGLFYKAVSEKGPTITITFESAEGLEAGKTKIKFKDVEIGKVESITLSGDLKHVIARAELIKESKAYLNEKTRFWVVRARFAGGVATGLGTLLSGSYIAIDPGRDGDPKSKPKKNFTGLEIPPIVTSGLPGRHFKLRAAKMGSLQHGSPVYFKGFKVGQVDGYKFSDQNDDLEIKIFIEEPYDKKVYHTTRFWFASGLDMVLDSEGVRIDTESLVSMVIGGISFANPEHKMRGSIAKEETIFNLYNNSQEALVARYAQKDYYLLKFDHSVRGLAIDAPVEFRGFPIGKVVDIWLEIDPENNQVKIPVKIQVEPERINKLVKNTRDLKIGLEEMVNLGMRAQLKRGNFITGSLYVAVDFFETAEPAQLVVHDNIIEIPTIPATMDELANDLTALLDRVSKFPVEKIGAQTLKTIQGIEETSSSFRKAGEGINQLIASETAKETITSLNRSLEKLELLMSQMEQDLPRKVDSISNQAFEAMKEFTRAAQSIRMLADQLERHPESILKGKE